MIFKYLRKILDGLNTKMTIFQKLLIGVIALLALVVLLVYIGKKGVLDIQTTSQTIQKEYVKQNELQNLKLSLSQLLMPANDYLISGAEIEIENFEIVDSIVKRQILDYKKEDYPFSKQQTFKDVEHNFQEIEMYSKKIFNLKNPIGNPKGIVMMEVMDDISVNSVKIINELLTKSNLELKEYVNTNQNIISSSTKRMSILLLIIITSVIFGGFFYVRTITKPIDQLTLAAQKINDETLISNSNNGSFTNDKIISFANLFNDMIGTLSKKTVSRSYIESIIHRMHESLIITDIHGIITIVNQATLDLLNYEEEELIGKSINIILFKTNETGQIISNEETFQNIYNTYYTKSKAAIPISFSKSIIYDYNKKDDTSIKSGILFLGYHYSKKLSVNQESAGTLDINKRKFKLIGEIPLTKRELEIIKLIVKEYTNQEIADILFISIRTVETHRKHIMEKLQTKSIIALVKYAVQNELT